MCIANAIEQDQWLWALPGLNWPVTARDWSPWGLILMGVHKIWQISDSSHRKWPNCLKIILIVRDVPVKVKG